MSHTKKRGPEISLEKKSQLVGVIAMGQSIGKAARKFGFSKSTAHDIWKKYQKTGSAENLPRSGRPRKLDERSECSIVRQALSERRKPFSEIANSCYPKVSPSTVRNVLRRHNIRRRVARRVPYLKKAHKKARLSWAKICKHYKVQHWKKRIWSDECYIYLGDNRGRIFVTRRPGEEFFEECCAPKFPQSSVRVMIWACIMKGKKGPLVVLEYPGGKGGGMNSKRYQEQVLDPVLKPFYEKVSKDKGGVEFQQDNAPSHRSKTTLKWFSDNQIRLSYHPPNSPDLNPIERVWWEIKKRLKDREHIPTTAEELISAVKEIWE
ncbi:hypothetical protein D9613_007970 [Agrocybe pediades]|uniref:Transposase n=1 Tax=Agrocybe pediades TaxID=84607 RepID=A0A8H4QNK2_9AGAR|nr:hypothetical protein D9613_007970 [Agrocybe pediades]